MSKRECVTHHHACDCREAAHATELARLRSIVSAADALRDAVDLFVGDYPAGNPEWHQALDGYDAARGPRE